MTAGRLGFADLVISGGPILTMDEGQPHAQCVAVRAGRIAAVGSAEKLAATIGPRTEQLDLDGRTLMPGLIDPHMHSAMVQMADWVDISPMATPTESEIHDALRAASPTSTGWVLAKNFDPSITTAIHPSNGRCSTDLSLAADHRPREQRSYRLGQLPSTGARRHRPSLGGPADWALHPRRGR